MKITFNSYYDGNKSDGVQYNIFRFEQVLESDSPTRFDIFGNPLDESCLYQVRDYLHVVPFRLVRLVSVRSSHLPFKMH